MAVLVEATSVIVRRVSVESRYAGGSIGFVRRIPNATFCTDGDLARIGFMSPEDTSAFIRLLEHDGLRYLAAGQAIDLVVVDQHGGPVAPARWLSVGAMDVPGGTVQACWLAGAEPGALRVPRDWTFETSLSRQVRFVPNGERDRFVFVRRTDGTDVYEDRETGEKRYIGRAPGLADAVAAVEAQADEVRASLLAIRAASAEIDHAMDRGDFTTVQLVRRGLVRQQLPTLRGLTLGPARRMWQAHHALGFLLRVLGRFDEAEVALRAADEIEPRVLDVLLAIVAVQAELGKHDVALPFARRAVELAPDSLPAKGNLAACLLEIGELDEAEGEIALALDLDPTDEVNLHIQARLRDLRRQRSAAQENPTALN